MVKYAYDQQERLREEANEEGFVNYTQVIWYSEEENRLVLIRACFS